jgi:hypothetical protein
MNTVLAEDYAAENRLKELLQEAGLMPGNQQ